MFVEPRIVGSHARLLDGGPNLLPELASGVPEQVVDEDVIDQVPPQKRTDLVVDVGNVRADMTSSSQGLEEGVVVVEVGPVELVKRLLEVEAVSGRIQPHDEVGLPDPRLVPDLEAVEDAGRDDARRGYHDRDSGDAHARRVGSRSAVLTAPI